MRQAASFDEEYSAWYAEGTQDQRKGQVSDMAYEILTQWIQEANHIVFFGGAGVSTECGIPDFRSEKGIYRIRNKYGISPEEILSHSFFMEHPATFYEYYRENMLFPDAKPSMAHKTLAYMESIGKLDCVITQNIDALHQEAGSKRVYELHGSVKRNYCMRCKQFYPMETILESDKIPTCPKCHGLIKPDVVLYEEPLDEQVFNGSLHAILRADLMIVGGTSLNVYPAAGLLQYFQGNHLVLINLSKTPYDSMADLVIHEKIGTVMSAIYENLQG